MLNLIHKETLKDIDGTAWSAKTMSADTTYSSGAVRSHFTSGKAAIYVVSTAGTITITYQASDTGKSFYDPYDANGTANTIVEALPITTGRWIMFDIGPSEWIRIQVAVAETASSVSMDIKWRE